MGTTADIPRADPDMLMEFLTHIVPFNALDTEKLRELSETFCHEVLSQADRCIPTGRR